jgi:ABC-type transport system involved in multi-copper enzyme maturation permease subunit
MRARGAGLLSSVGAVATKELRGRVRGPRAFIAITVYLAVLAGVALIVYTAQRDALTPQSAFGGGNPYVAAQVGQALFATLLLLQVLLVVFLAPAATSGAISLEREKQTLDMLTATPVSTLGIVLGKLAAAAAFVAILIVGSIPLTALVFLFGGVAPEDVLRGYAVLFVTAMGFGCVGLFISSLTRRTQTATILTFVAVLVLTAGTGFGLALEFALYGSPRAANVMVRDVEEAGRGDDLVAADDAVASQAHPVPWPPDVLVLFNPFVAAADVICGADVNPYSQSCLVVASVTGRSPGSTSVETVPMPMPVDDIKGGEVEPGVAIELGVAGAAQALEERHVLVEAFVNLPAPVVDGPARVAAAEPFVSTSTRDAYWPRSAAAWLVTSLVLVLAAAQFVSPTRRWRIFRRWSRREARS